MHLLATQGEFKHFVFRMIYRSSWLCDFAPSANCLFLLDSEKVPPGLFDLLSQP